MTFSLKCKKRIGLRNVGTHKDKGKEEGQRGIDREQYGEKLNNSSRTV
jgi:hypothetical protein